MKKYMRLMLLAYGLSINCMNQAADDDGGMLNSVDLGNLIQMYEVNVSTYLVLYETLRFSKSEAKDAATPDFSLYNMKKVAAELQAIDSSFTLNASDTIVSLQNFIYSSANNNKIAKTGPYEINLGDKCISSQCLNGNIQDLKNGRAPQGYTIVDDKLIPENEPGNIQGLKNGRAPQGYTIVDDKLIPEDEPGNIQGLKNGRAPQGYTIKAIINGSLFKSSCAATIAGIVTYYTVGWYNDGKKKEEQYSQKRWALGCAAIAGLGTFAFLHWPEKMGTLSEDDFTDDFTDKN